MLLMGMWMSLTKKPMKPMRTNPIAVAMAILVHSFLKFTKYKDIFYVQGFSAIHTCQAWCIS